MSNVILATEPVAGSPSSTLLSRTLRLCRSRPLMTLVDQGIVSAGNFLTALLVARHLSTSDFGAYGLLLETMLFLNAMQAALVVYPLTVLSNTDRDSVGRCATASLLMTLAMLPVLGLAMAIAAFYGASHVGLAARVGVAAAGVSAMLLWQAQETARRSLLAELRAGACIPGDFVSYIGQLVMLYLLWKTNHLTLTTALISIGLTSAAAALLQAVQVGLEPVRVADLRRLTSEYWRLGRWPAFSNSTALITSIGFVWTLKLSHGLEQTGDYYAINAPLKLANPILLGFGNILVPTIARVRHGAGIRTAARVALGYCGLAGAMIFPYFLLLLLAPATAITLYFGQKSAYVAQAPLLQIYCLNLVSGFVVFCANGWLNGLAESKLNFHAQVVNALATLLVTLPASYVYGLHGLLVGSVVAGMIAAVGQVAVFGVWLRRYLATRGKNLRSLL